MLLLWYRPFKIQREKQAVSSLLARIILAEYWPLLEFAGKYL
jgi:hypothetical protein